VAVVPAGGQGRRLGGGLPKQFRRLGGVPLLALTLRALARCPAVEGLVVVVPRAQLAMAGRLLERFAVPRVLAVVAGGAERQDSVWQGLQAVPAETELVLVHDAVRPFVTARLVARVLSAAAGGGAAICALPVRDTIKRVRDGLVVGTLDREGLWLVQTPQAFRRALLWEAHDKARRDGAAATDDAGLVERLGAPVAVVPGLEDNVKLTTPADLRWARRRVEARAGAGGRVARAAGAGGRQPGRPRLK
jgi:2-C-methyl-D-erythritol 4-phosphate cytidylyltransferase